MSARRSVFVIGLLLVAFATAWAGDDLQVTVTTPQGYVQPAIKENGNDATKGTIQLLYTVNAYSFTPGEFAVFTLNLKAVHLTGTQNAVYPAPLTIVQNGSDRVTLTPQRTELDVTGLGWSDSVDVKVTLAPDVSATDGTELVANLNLSVPGNNKIGTPTSIQVHIKLVEPTTCLKVYNFIMDQDFTGILSSAVVNLTKRGVVSTNPGQFADNVMVVNTCPEPQSFDLKIELDPRFETNPSGNPGNAVFTYTTAGEVDPTTFNILAFGTGTKEGQKLCLQDVTVPGGTTFLATVHSEVIKGQSATALGTAPFQFLAHLTNPSSACDTTMPVASASPNPASIPLPFTIK